MISQVICIITITTFQKQTLINVTFKYYLHIIDSQRYGIFGFQRNYT